MEDTVIESIPVGQISALSFRYIPNCAQISQPFACSSFSHGQETLRNRDLIVWSCISGLELRTANGVESEHSVARKSPVKFWGIHLHQSQPFLFDD